MQLYQIVVVIFHVCSTQMFNLEPVFSGAAGRGKESDAMGNQPEQSVSLQISERQYGHHRIEAITKVPILRRKSRSTITAGNWLSKSINITLDGSTATIHFDAANPRLQIDRYRIFLKDNTGVYNDMRNDVYSNSTNIVQTGAVFTGRTTFTNVRPGSYCVEVLAKPTDTSVCHDRSGRKTIIKSCKMKHCQNFTVPSQESNHKMDKENDANDKQSFNSETTTPWPQRTTTPWPQRTTTPWPQRTTHLATNSTLLSPSSKEWSVEIVLALLVFAVVFLIVYCGMYIKKKTRHRQSVIEDKNPCSKPQNNTTGKKLSQQWDSEEDPAGLKKNEVNHPEENSATSVASRTPQVPTCAQPNLPQLPPARSDFHQPCRAGTCTGTSINLAHHEQTSWRPCVHHAGMLAGERVNRAYTFRDEYMYAPEQPFNNSVDIPPCPFVDGKQMGMANHTDRNQNNLSDQVWIPRFQNRFDHTECYHFGHQAVDEGMGGFPTIDYELLNPSRYSLGSSQFTEMLNTINSSTQDKKQGEAIFRSCPSLLSGQKTEAALENNT